MPGLVIHAFDGDAAGSPINKSANEIVFTAYHAATGENASVSPFGFVAHPIAPAPFFFVTLTGPESPWFYRAKLSVFEGVDVPEGVYLFLLQIGTSTGLGGFALATANVTADIPRLPIPETPEDIEGILMQRQQGGDASPPSGGRPAARRRVARKGGAPVRRPKAGRGRGKA
jgi:hypothetical protein